MGSVLTSEDMSTVLFAQVELHPITNMGDEMTREIREVKQSYQSKLKGIASGPMFPRNTFLSSSKEIVPDASLQGEDRSDKLVQASSSTHTSKY
jgi:hypothetical protein